MVITMGPRPGPLELPFPRVRARDLEGRDVELPADFVGARTVAILAFQREHQDLVDSWVPWLDERAAADPGFRFYEIPTISGRWSLARRFIDGGMAAAIRVPAVLQRTFTFYGDTDRLAGPLQITDRSTISLFVVGADGTVTWGEQGRFDPGAAERLSAALDAIPD
jgi:hypothetical protein